MHDLYHTLIRPFLFRLDPETAHSLTLRLLAVRFRRAGLRDRNGLSAWSELPVNVLGLRFRNPVGLAAGLDKDGVAPAAFARLGFGSVELGTVTPLRQSGNPRPRMFRLVQHEAIINRMGFNSRGIEGFGGGLSGWPRPFPVGVNIGKNAITPPERVLADYRRALAGVYSLADYVTVNISSPNTPGLRDLQAADALNHLLSGLLSHRDELADRHGRRVPIAVKISPDLDDDAIRDIAGQLLTHAVDAVIATNTTVSRPGVESHPLSREAGGLSGAPLRALALRMTRSLRQALGERIPVIGVGGICSADDAWERIVAGADLLQVYTGFIYRGPRLVRDIVARLRQETDRGDYADYAAMIRSIRCGTNGGMKFPDLPAGRP